jgi:chromosome segregation ATPase
MSEMSLDGLPGQFEQFVERARAVLGREITAAKNLVAAAKAEKTSAQNALSNLQNQCKLAQDQLDAVKSELERGSTLVGLNREIAAARKTLASLQADTERANQALEKLSKERTEREAQLNVLRNEAQRMIAIRTEGEAVMANLRAQLNSVQIGHRP